MCSTVMAVGEQVEGKISVTIDGFDNNQGQALIALHSSKKTYLKKVEPFRRAIVPIQGTTIIYTFENVPYGDYSIAVFQDDNKNMDLDMEKLVFPKEKYGFSNNVRGKYGPPGFDKTKFKLASSELDMSITIAKP